MAYSWYPLFIAASWEPASATVWVDGSAGAASIGTILEAPAIKPNSQLVEMLPSTIKALDITGASHQAWPRDW